MGENFERLIVVVALVDLDCRDSITNMTIIEAVIVVVFGWVVPLVASLRGTLPRRSRLCAEICW